MVISMQNTESERFREASSVLSSDLHKMIISINPSIKEKATEIRLRVGRPLTVCCGKRIYYVTPSGNTSEQADNNSLFMVNQKCLSECFQRLCGFSVYSYQKELRQGYLTFRGGHRAGICGTAVINDNEIVGMRDITSINIRISRQITDAAAQLYAKIGNELEGTLIAGMPACGKTTVLRDFARRISLSGKNVTVIDERGELSGAWNGNIINDLGMCDVLNGYPKAQGIIRAIRAMSPDVIICDEIGSKDDCKAIESAINTGVKIVASIHAQSLDGLSKHTQTKELLDMGVFKYIVMLSGKNSPGKIEGIYTRKVDSYVKNYGNNSSDKLWSSVWNLYGSQT